VVKVFVEWHEAYEEEDDIEDFSGLPIEGTDLDDDNGKILIVVCL
jgi:hypothetical protein